MPIYPTFSGPPEEPAAQPPGPAGGPVWYTNDEFLLWRIRGGLIPSGMSTAPIGLIATPVNNVFTRPSGATTITPSGVTTVSPVSIINNTSFGQGDRANYGTTLGGRFALGFWCDPDMTWGLEASGLVLERAIDHFAGIQGATPNQFLLNVGTSNQFLVAAGTVTPNGTTPIVLPRASVVSLAGNTSDSLYGGELNARCIGLRFGCVDVGGLLGFRYLSLQDDLSLFSNAHLFLPPGQTDPVGSTFSQDLNFNTTDHIRILNNFYAAQIGVDMDAKFGSFFFYARAKVALGDMNQRATVGGVTSVINNDTTRPIPANTNTLGGLLSSPGDAGQGFTRNRLAFLPELNLKLGYQVCSWLRCYVGYDVMDINNVARAGTSTTVSSLNSSISVAGATNNVSIAQPTFRFQDQHIVVQGANFGIELQY
jgi:hypothetical protein